MKNINEINFYTCLKKINADNQLSVMKEKLFKKGESLLQLNHIATNLYYIDYGLVKMSSDINDKQFIMQFFSENEMVTVLNSFNNQAPSKYRLTALEDTSLKYISYQDLNQLFLNYPNMETQYRHLQAAAINKMMQRINTMLIKKPYDRYHTFIKDYRELVQRISLGDISAY
ncbi:MAG: hypothetical protein CML02_17985 [Pseudooceanicola sp.]|nr:hypothetical protein [Pseudooceanicola sp.]